MGRAAESRGVSEARLKLGVFEGRCRDTLGEKGSI